jgi:hypothetical protein
MSLLSATAKLTAYIQQIQLEKLQLAQDLAAALADDAADQTAIDAALAKVAEIQATIDSGAGVDSADQTAIAKVAEIQATIDSSVDVDVQMKLLLKRLSEHCLMRSH